MNAFAQNAYRDAARVSKTPKETEAALLARMNLALQTAAGADYRTLARAVTDNMRLWNALSDDVVQPENGLPDALKAQIVWLAEFARVQGGRVLHQGGDVTPLIDVNNAVMRGLNGKSD
ncbi:MAG: flagellar biosynthesis regulator FlaF [Paracoccus sp. (in: a-proteobacteria)]|nr:flagellar biosynthesis regulator FlaF [Paracoccus sp. (in: a-proteobacteria)]